MMGLFVLGMQCHALSSTLDILAQALMLCVQILIRIRTRLQIR
jgi:hypothetical protein